MRYVVMTIVLILICLDLSMSQAVSHEEREYWRGLQGAEVVIEGIRPEAQEVGLYCNAN
jgi:hypothetical protein